MLGKKFYLHLELAPDCLCLVGVELQATASTPDVSVKRAVRQASRCRWGDSCHRTGCCQRTCETVWHVDPSLGQRNPQYMT